MNATMNATMEYQLYKQHQQDLLIGCQPKEAGYPTNYGYIPGLGAGVAFCVLFGLSMIIHTIQFCWKRTWWCAVFSVGALGKLNHPSVTHTTKRMIQESM